jgi:hypothetical protein
MCKHGVAHHFNDVYIKARKGGEGRGNSCKFIRWVVREVSRHGFRDRRQSIAATHVLERKA